MESSLGREETLEHQALIIDRGIVVFSFFSILFILSSFHRLSVEETKRGARRLSRRRGEGRRTCSDVVGDST